MSVRDKWPFSRYEGRVRVEFGPYTSAERERVRDGSVVFVVGVLVASLTQDWPLAVFAMAVAGVFVRVYYR